MLLTAYVCLAAWFTLHGVANSLPAAFVKSDFRAYYCAARVAAAGEDPYLAAPLGACETELGASVGLKYDPRFPDPAPLPGYVITAFMPLASLPYPYAAAVWYAVLLAAIALSAVLLAQLTGLPLVVAGAMVYGTELVGAVQFAQLAPLVTLALLAAAALMRRGRDGFAGLTLSLTLLQPQVGLPVALAAFLWKPGMRRGLVAGAVVFALAAWRGTGPHGTDEFLRVVLPAQAFAQVPLDIQYGLAWLLHVAGLREAAAVRIATLQYAATALAAVLLARRAARALQADEALLFFPAAASVLGGSYIHEFQFCLALPFAALLLARSEGALRSVAAAAAVLLALPSAIGWTSSLFVFAALGTGPIVYRATAGRALGVRRAAAVLAVCSVFFLPQFLASVPRTTLPAGPLSSVQAQFPDELASVRLGERIRELPAATDVSLRLLAEKSLKWLPVLALAVIGFGAALRPREPAADRRPRLRYIL
jgi:hypothetical protein